MMDDGLPSIAERDLRAEEEWCRVALNAQSRASRVSEELAGLARDHEAQGKLLQQAVAALAAARSAPVAVEVPTPTVEEWWSMVLTHPNIVGSSEKFSAHETGMRDTLDFVRGRLRPIPSDRVLKEGEVAIRADILAAMEGCVSTLRADAELIPSKALAHLDAIRSSTNHDSKETP